MKTMSVKERLFLFMLLLGISFFVLGEIRLARFLNPLLWIFPLFITYPWLIKIRTLLFQALAALAVAAYLVILLLQLPRLFLCGYKQMGDFYTRKGNENIKLTGRDWSCYGTTGDLILYKQFTLSPHLKIEYYYKTCPDHKVDIDTTEWDPVR